MILMNYNDFLNYFNNVLVFGKNNSYNYEQNLLGTSAMGDPQGSSEAGITSDTGLSLALGSEMLE